MNELNHSRAEENEMHPIEMNKLQVLNDLITQTIDAINQRNFAGAGTPYGGLSHSPYLGASVPVQPPQVPWAAAPFQTVGMGHSPFDPRLAAPMSRPVGIDPRWSVSPYAAGTLSHTPFVDPRWSVPAQVYGIPYPYLR